MIRLIALLTFIITIQNCKSQKQQVSSQVKVSQWDSKHFTAIREIKAIVEFDYPEFDFKEPGNALLFSEYASVDPSKSWRARFWYLKPRLSSSTSTRRYDLDFALWDYSHSEEVSFTRMRGQMVKNMDCQAVSGARVFCSCRYSDQGAFVFDLIANDGSEPLPSGLLFYKKQDDDWKLIRFMGIAPTGKNTLQPLNAVINVTGSGDLTVDDMIESSPQYCESTPYMASLPEAEKITDSAFQKFPFDKYYSLVEREIPDYLHSTLEP
jgi:hypothetical protein